jgi:hypothetical protein
MASEALKIARLERKAQREARNWEREKVLYEKVLTPEVVRLGMIAGIIAYSTYCARSEHNVGPVQSALAFAGPGIGIPILAAQAGIKDKYALAAISAAGIAYTTGQMGLGWESAGILSSVADQGKQIWQQVLSIPGTVISEIGDLLG